MRGIAVLGCVFLVLRVDVNDARCKEAETWWVVIGLESRRRASKQRGIALTPDPASSREVS